MGLEAATWGVDLDPTNPPSGDKKSQGDDHLRLIKQVFKNCFPGASKAWYNPTASSKTADFAVAATDMNRTFVIDTTSGVVNATLPTLVSGDAGWECSFIKSNAGVNPYFIFPNTGTISSGEVFGLVKTRRCIPGHRTRVLWTGTGWIAERVVKSPVGTVLDCPVAALPVGYEFAMGQTLSASYPDYIAVMGGGVVIDRQGRVSAGRTNMDGSDNGLITTAGCGVDGTALGGFGGVQNNTLLTANLPPYTPVGTNSVPVTTAKRRNRNDTLGSGATEFITENQTDGNSVDNAVTVSAPVFTGTAQGGISTPISNMPPIVISNMIVVVE